MAGFVNVRAVVNTAEGSVLTVSNIWNQNGGQRDLVQVEMPNGATCSLSPEDLIRAINAASKA